MCDHFNELSGNLAAQGGISAFAGWAFDIFSAAPLQLVVLRIVYPADRLHFPLRHSTERLRQRRTADETETTSCLLMLMADEVLWLSALFRILNTRKTTASQKTTQQQQSTPGKQRELSQVKSSWVKNKTLTKDDQETKRNEENEKFIIIYD